MYKMSEHKDEIVTHIIKNLIWAPIAAIIPIVFALIKNILADIKESKNILTITNILIIVSIVIMVFLFIFLRRLVSNNDNGKNDLLFSEFRAKTMEAELSFTNRENLMSKITYKMNVLSNGVSEMKRSITWTGSEYIKTTLSNTNGDYSLVDSNRKFSPHTIKILFNSEKNSGDFVRFTTNTKVLDTNHEMSPNYSFMVKYQIDELILHVVAPENLIKNVKKAVYADVAKEIVIEKPTDLQGENIGNLVRYTYRVPTPSFLYNYFIEWEFTN